MKCWKPYWDAAIENNNIYNRAVFKDCFPSELNAKPCKVHAVGKLFEHEGVMKMKDSRNYQIIS
ncbi:hypothetical protein [Flavicella sediminum]|uniref:hypothetical protein n=1 Tax=Flavicella sediminum TaxID=2585141 RepID=UPI001AA06B8A|nr:hypothetical protein [Flavicella sediminum]